VFTTSLIAIKFHEKVLHDIYSPQFSPLPSWIKSESSSVV